MMIFRPWCLRCIIAQQATRLGCKNCPIGASFLECVGVNFALFVRVNLRVSQVVVSDTRSQKCRCVKIYVLAKSSSRFVANMNSSDRHLWFPQQQVHYHFFRKLSLISYGNNSAASSWLRLLRTNPMCLINTNQSNLFSIHQGAEQVEWPRV